MLLPNVFCTVHMIHERPKIDNPKQSSLKRTCRETKPQTDRRHHDPPQSSIIIITTIAITIVTTTMLDSGL